MTQRNLYIAGVLVVLVAIAVGSWAQTYTTERSFARSLQAGCKRGIEKELLNIKDVDLRITGNYAIARDWTQTPVTRSARLEQARGEEASREERYRFVDHAHGGPLVCADLYPYPSIVP